MAKKKKKKLTFSVNQITPGIVGEGRHLDRRQPAAEEKDRQQRAHGHDRHIFRQHEQNVGRRRIFDHEAGDEFRFRFDEIEGRAVRLGQRGNEEDHEHRQEAQPIPAEHAVFGVLRAARCR